VGVQGPVLEQVVRVRQPQPPLQGHGRYEALVISTFIGRVGWVIAAAFSLLLLSSRRSEECDQFAVAECGA
jgi:hypothetical protein